MKIFVLYIVCQKVSTIEKELNNQVNKMIHAVAFIYQPLIISDSDGHDGHPNEVIVAEIKAVYGPNNINSYLPHVI